MGLSKLYINFDYYHQPKKEPLEIFQETLQGFSIQNPSDISETQNSHTMFIKDTYPIEHNNQLFYPTIKLLFVFNQDKHKIGSGLFFGFTPYEGSDKEKRTLHELPERYIEMYPAIYDYSLILQKKIYSELFQEDYQEENIKLIKRTKRNNINFYYKGEFKNGQQ